MGVKEEMKYSEQQKRWIRRTVWILFLAYIGAMAYFLFFNEEMNRTTGDYGYNLTLFKEIRRGFWCLTNGMEGYFFLNVIMNIVAFMPFGFILPILSPKNRRFLNAALLSLELTLTIEILQLVLKAGRFDVDDIILNALGGMLGYFAYFIARKFEKKIMQH